jgi:hypothetical protein
MFPEVEEFEIPVVVVKEHRRPKVDNSLPEDYLKLIQRYC